LPPSGGQPDQITGDNFEHPSTGQDQAYLQVVPPFCRPQDLTGVAHPYPEDIRPEGVDFGDQMLIPEIEVTMVSADDVQTMILAPGLVGGPFGQTELPTQEEKSIPLLNRHFAQFRPNVGGGQLFRQMASQQTGRQDQGSAVGV
jgi:hypothetical protein